jgi:hypothetical protein
MMCLPESAECYADPDCGPGRICHAFACEAAPVQCWAESDCADGWECVVDCTQLPQPPDPGGRMACPAFCQPKAPPEEPACGIDGLTCPDGTVCGCDPNGDGSTCVPACLPEAPVPPPWDCRDDADCGGGGFCQVVVCADPICDAAGVCTGGGCYGHCRAPYDCATDADCASGSCLRDQTTCTAEDDCKGWCQDTPPATCEGDCDCRLDQTCHRGADGVGTCRHLGTRNSCDWLGCRSDAECARGETCAIMCPSCMPGALCPPCTGTCFASQR